MGILLIQPYLPGTRFTIRADEEGLQWIINTTYDTLLVARWRLRILVFGYEVVKHYGVKNQMDVPISRLEKSGTDTKPIDNDDPMFIIADDGCLGHLY